MTKPENALKPADEAERQKKKEAEVRAKLDEMAAKQKQRAQEELEEREKLRRAALNQQAVVELV